MAFFFEQWKNKSEDTKEWVTIEGKPVLIGGPGSGGGSSGGGSSGEALSKSDQQILNTTSSLLQAGFGSNSNSSGFVTSFGREAAEQLNSTRIFSGYTVYSSNYAGFSIQPNGTFENHYFAAVTGGSGTRPAQYKQAVQWLGNNGWKAKYIKIPDVFEGIIVDSPGSRKAMESSY